MGKEGGVALSLGSSCTAAAEAQVGRGSPAEAALRVGCPFFLSSPRVSYLSKKTGATPTSQDLALKSQQAKLLSKAEKSRQPNYRWQSFFKEAIYCSIKYGRVHDTVQNVLINTLAGCTYPFIMQQAIYTVL